MWSVLAIALALTSLARADTVVGGYGVGVTDKGPDILAHQYDLTVTAGDMEVLGVIVLNALTVFDVGPASPIAPPPNWSFIPPLDADAADLSYFSNTDDANIKMKQKLGGFVFESPDDLPPSFKVDLVVKDGTIKEINVVTTPEPSFTALLGSILLSMLIILKGRAALATRRRRYLVFSALSKNPTEPRVHAAFSKATNSVLVAAKR